MRWMHFDRIVELVPKQRMVTVKGVTLSEEVTYDHFPAIEGREALPVMPASLIIEGMAQTAGLLVGHAEDFKEKVVLAKIGSAELDREVPPGFTIKFTATIRQMDRMGASTEGIVEMIDPAAPENPPVRIGRIDLMFSHVDQNMTGVQFPEENFVYSDTFKTVLRMAGIEV